MSNDFDKKLQMQISQLHRHRMPERDLWPGIEVAVTTKKYRYTPWVAVAASIVACVLSGWLLMNRYRASDDATSQIVAQLDASHQQEMSALRAAFRNTRSVTTNWNEQLHDMDQAADAIKTALRHDPHNITLLKMLSDLYQKEIELLETVHQPNLQNPDLI